MIEQPRFLYVCCQVGAEAALKSEVARQWPGLRFAFSRPGFLTFKRTSDSPLPDDFDLKSTFARCHGFSIGRVEADAGDANAFATLAQEAWKKIEGLPIRRWHVWQRDSAAPGEHGFEPAETELARATGQAILAATPEGRGQETPAQPEGQETQGEEGRGQETRAQPVTINMPARPGELVADCVLVEPNQWWIGYHVASSIAARWPGGIPPLTRPEGMISRAYMKLNEALDWSRFPIRRGEICLEIGSSPGGACQALLDRGFTVIGVDPAAMDERLLARERFTHVRKRAEDMKRKDFHDVNWLFVDSNVAPATTLAIVEDIVTHHQANIRGLLLTIKLLDWTMANEAPDYMVRVPVLGI